MYSRNASSHDLKGGPFVFNNTLYCGRLAGSGYSELGIGFTSIVLSEYSKIFFANSNQLARPEFTAW